MNSPITKPLILSVDDDQDTLKLIEQLLTKTGYNVVTTGSGSNALLAINKEKPDLILLDIMMPDMDGYDVSSKLQENKATAYIPYSGKISTKCPFLGALRVFINICSRRIICVFIPNRINIAT